MQIHKLNLVHSHKAIAPAKPAPTPRNNSTSPWSAFARSSLLLPSTAGDRLSGF